MKKLSEVFDAAKHMPTQKIAVAAPDDPEIMTALENARKLGLINPVLIGDSISIESIAKQLYINLASYQILNETDPAQSALTAVSLVSSGQADIVMKGHLQSSVFLKAIIDKKVGLRLPGKDISTIAIMECTQLNRLVFITDPGFTPVPDLDKKISILKNAIEIAQKFGIAVPKVAVLSAAETVNPKLTSSIDAEIIASRGAAGEFGRCIIAGPVSLDIALFEESAINKGYTNPVGGHADILLVPNIDVGNVLYKTMAFYSHTPTGGITAGAKAPIVFTSRSDNAETKLNTIAMAVYQSQKEEVDT